MLGIFVLHDRYDNPVETVRTLEAVVADVGQWATVYAIDNGEGRLPKGMTGVQVVMLRPGLFHVDAYMKVLVSRPCDIYILIKSGVVVERGTIAKLAAALADEAVGVVAPTMYRVEDALITGTGLSEQKFVRDWCWGWRHDLIKAIGWLDWQMQVHRECPGSEVDYCYRARQHGYQIMQVNEARAVLPGTFDPRWTLKARGWLVQKYGVLKISEVW